MANCYNNSRRVVMHALDPASGDALLVELLVLPPLPDDQLDFTRTYDEMLNSIIGSFGVPAHLIQNPKDSA